MKSTDHKRFTEEIKESPLDLVRNNTDNIAFHLVIDLFDIIPNELIAQYTNWFLDI